MTSNSPAEYWERKSIRLQDIVDTQKQYLANKDSVIKGMNEMITKLEGDLEVMRLQRDATRSSRCPSCERLHLKITKALVDNGRYVDALREISTSPFTDEHARQIARAALKGVESNE